VGGYYEDQENKTSPIPCRHRTSPSEPWGRLGQRGHILRVTPAAPAIPAMAYVQWEEGNTWEQLKNLSPASGQ
jgi:hypothetical protein